MVHFLHLKVKPSSFYHIDIELRSLTSIIYLKKALLPISEQFENKYTTEEQVAPAECYTTNLL